MSIIPTTILIPEPEQGHYIKYPVGDDIIAAIDFTNKSAAAFNDNFASYEYVNIWCRGSSGAILAALFASKLNAANIKIIHIKKEGEHSHGNVSPLSSYSDPINVIIDDFIATGDTLNKIYKAVKSTGINIVDVLVIGNGHSSYKLTFQAKTIISYPEIE